MGAKVVHHGRYVTFQLAEVVVSRDLFRKILRIVVRLDTAWSDEGFGVQMMVGQPFQF